MSLFQRFIKYFTRRKYPKCLLINGRKKLPTSSFQDQDKLYRSYNSEELDENDKIKLERIKFPDLSCNWSKFSEPEDVLFSLEPKPSYIKTEVYIIEVTGSYNIIDIKLGGEESIRVRTIPTIEPGTGENAYINFDDDRINIFDKDTEDAIF